MNTMNPSPAPPVAQPKTIDERIAEAKAKSAELMYVYLKARDAAEPFENARNAAATQWTEARKRVEFLEGMKKEMAQ